MSQQAWKPVKLSSSSKGGHGDHSSACILVDLVIHNDVVKKTFQDIIHASPALRVKEANETAVPRLVILELDEDPTESFAFINSVVQAMDGREMFLTSPRTDTTVLLEALRAGAKEFFPQPIQRQEVEQALAQFTLRCKESVQEPKKLGQVFCVFGGKGGVGTTSFAVNLAFALQADRGRQAVVLLEVNQQAGDLPLFLDLHPAHSFRDIGADLSRLDTALLTRLLLKHESGLHVLPSGYDDLSSGRLTPECIEPTLGILQSLFDFVVIDCGYVLDLTTRKAIELSSSIMLISTLTVPVVHRTKRILDIFRGSGYDPEKIKLILNRYTPEDLDVLRETEDALKCKASWVIPNDYPTACNALNNGSPMILSSPRTPVAKSYKEVASTLVVGPSANSGNGNWLDRLRGVMLGQSKFKQSQTR